MAAVLADGTTVIDNAAREPEIVDLCTMLQQMGAKIDGVGTSTLTVHGVDRPAARPTHRVIGDRIVGATWAFAAAMTRGEVTVRGVDPHHLDLVLDKLRSAGRRDRRSATEEFRCRWPGRPQAVDFVTLPYPGFATDLQPMAIALSAVADGTSMITENVFEARFRFVDEMVRLGADARTDGHHAVVRGVRAAVQRAGVGQRHPGRRRAGAGRAVRRRRRPRCGTSSTSTAATRGSWRTCATLGRRHRPGERRARRADAAGRGGAARRTARAVSGRRLRPV